MERFLVWRTHEFQAFDLKLKRGLNNKALCCHKCLTPLSSRPGTWVLLLNWNPLGPDRVFLSKSNSILFQNTAFVCQGSASVMSELILENQGQETYLDGSFCLFISERQSAHPPQQWQIGLQGLLCFQIWGGSISKIGRKNTLKCINKESLKSHKNRVKEVLQLKLIPFLPLQLSLYFFSPLQAFKLPRSSLKRTFPSRVCGFMSLNTL